MQSPTDGYNKQTAREKVWSKSKGSSFCYSQKTRTKNKGKKVGPNTFTWDLSWEVYWLAGKEWKKEGKRKWSAAKNQDKSRAFLSSAIPSALVTPSLLTPPTQSVSSPKGAISFSPFFTFSISTATTASRNEAHVTVLEVLCTFFASTGKQKQTDPFSRTVTTTREAAKRQ